MTCKNRDAATGVRADWLVYPVNHGGRWRPGPLRLTSSEFGEELHLAAVNFLRGELLKSILGEVGKAS